MEPTDLPDLPIRPLLGDIAGTLAARGSLVLVAPPGTGKTTLVPLALPGRVVVAEPRRLAARAAAARMAGLLGEPVGRTVGYSVRGDRKTSKDTRVEVVTSGLLVRRLQHDPELAGVDTVLLDECHERHLDADLLLALLLDARAGLRPDLKLLATSATLAAERLARLLGDAPVLRVEARAHPVEVVHAPPARGERVEAAVARATRQALSEVDGDVLAFLPGVAEIRRCAALLGDVDVLPLHGRLPASAQDEALRPGPRRRVVLATAVAESSLTVPGVRAVVDSGLARVPRVDHRRGLAGLATVRVSAAVADQRAGRAGREAPGRVYRCWPAHEHGTLPRYPEPEIRTADLTRLALELACWGVPDGTGLGWWDAPPPGALDAGRSVLRALGALDGRGATERGRRMADLGLHPRLARALLDGAAAVGAHTAAQVVALLDDDRANEGVELSVRHADPREVRRLAALVGGRNPGGERGTRGRRGTGGDPALVVALAHPERLARRRSPGSPVYLMAGGTAVELPPGSGLADAEWLAVAVADREPGRAHGRVRLAARADEELALTAAPALVVEEDDVRWDGDVVANRVRRLGAIPLSSKPLRDPEALRRALREGLRAEGVGLLRWDADGLRTRERMAFLHRVLGDPWPAVDDGALLEVVDLGDARRRADLQRISGEQVVRRLLPWPAAARFDELAPDRLEVPSGSRVRVDYSGPEPVLPVKVQEVFGWTETPRLAGGRVPVVLHLLSPAGRPTAVTGDLASFWRTGYPQVRAELRGRYPKHRWPEDPMTAPPARR
ncbi:ATP-dependent helicase HrpB [Saccharothrix syringae]|uniref:ATP-dependent helicase HrpB n=1 Tax=Saccharothrix syringae TaxID=103733 RepID=A0A5Q0GS89_SACSY|nr:ATP-dependent helicase HrpB [Saccharothrix syringae]QFZ16927.1 ATP-dependent helicase HrpB [Saccharothrix syringae]